LARQGGEAERKASKAADDDDVRQKSGERAIKLGELLIV